MPRPTRLTLPTTMTAAAAGQDARAKLTEKKGSEHPRMSSVRRVACTTPNSDIPSRCTTRGTGVIRVCSIVPSHRSHMMTRLMSSRMADRYAHPSVPTSKKRVSLDTWAARMTPVRPASLAMKVMARVLTTP